MSSPRSIGGSVREGTRVVLREITATLHNSPPLQPPRRKSGNDSPHPKSAEHEVKVRFAREFADVGSIAYSAPESLSSASSFHSLSSSLSTKSSSGICADSVPQSPNEASNISYVNPTIPGVDDLISACADIQLTSDEDRSFPALHYSQDLSQDQTFASAIDESVAELTKDSLSENFQELSSQNIDQIDENLSTHESTRSFLERTQEIQDRPILNTICVREPLPVVPYVSKDDGGVSKAKDSVDRSVSPNKTVDESGAFKTCSLINGLEETPLPLQSAEDAVLRPLEFLPPNKLALEIIKSKEEKEEEEEAALIKVPCIDETAPNFVFSPTKNFVPSVSVLTENAEYPSLPSISTISSLTDGSEVKFEETGSHDTTEDLRNLLQRSSSPVRDTSTKEAVSPRDQSKVVDCNEIVQKEQDEPVSLSDILASNVSKTTKEEETSPKQSNETPSVPIVPKTPEVPPILEANVKEEPETTSSNIVLEKVLLSPQRKEEISLSPQKSDSFVISTSTLGKEPNLWTIENTKLHDPLIAEGSDILGETQAISVTEEEETEEKAESSDEKLDTTLTLQDVSIHLDSAPDIEQYTEFKPQRQSTTLGIGNDRRTFEDLKSAAEEVANDIFKTSLEFTEESDRFVSATSEIFQDPTSFDFLLARSSSKNINRLRAESLYVKFDPLVSDISMLPQGNAQPISEEQNGKNESPLPNVGTPKRNPAIAAIDRLLFYSPLPSGTVQKTEEPQEKIEQPTEESKPDTALIVDINMSEELELVRATVLQLEEELKKQKKEYEAELERQKSAYQDKISKLQTQIAQEVKSKSQMTVVVEEYEKSISRLLTERERDRTNFEQEKTKLQEELQAANVHLTNTEAAFNDVHQKYERLKGVVSAYKSNETVLKESIQENMETIKGLETRYDQLKNHAMAQLEKANFELDAIRKQHEDETVKLHAMVRKAELKSNSLAELVEQKTKENKELTQILDEVIARVGHQNAE